MKISLCGALIAAMALTPLTLAAQTVYPRRPITMIVPFSARGGTDSIARDMAGNMADPLGQPVVIDSRGGAGGAIGADIVAKAKPDGYTVLFATSSFATNAAITVDLPYDAVKS